MQSLHRVRLGGSGGQGQCPAYAPPHTHPLSLHGPPASRPVAPQVPEHEREEWDSVTKLHQDMSDAVNILVHCQVGQG